jgi:hypothetical protein
MFGGASIDRLQEHSIHQPPEHKEIQGEKPESKHLHKRRVWTLGSTSAYFSLERRLAAAL